MTDENERSGGPEGERVEARPEGERVEARLEALVAARTRELTEANAALRLELAERLRSEERARRRELQYRSMVRSVPHAAMLLFDTDLRFVAAEGGDTLAISGFDQASIVGRTLAEVALPENLGVVEPVYRAALGGQSSTLQLARGGRDFSVYTGPVHDGHGAITGGLVFISDISLVKRAERLLQDNEARFRNLAEATFEGIALLDDGAIVEVNTALATMFGRPREELVGRRFGSLLLAGEAANVSAHLASASTDSRESIGLRADGSGFPIEVRGRSALLGGRSLMAVAVRDLSDRRRTEEALGRSERQFHQLVESIPDGVVVVREGRYVYLNPAALAIHGYRSLDELVGQSILVTIHPEDRPRVAAALGQGRSNAEARQMRETRSLRPDGTTVLLESVSFAMELDGQPSIVAAIRDITARKEAERAAHEATALWRAILDGSDHSIIATTPGGLIREFNPAAERLLGYAAADVIGRTTPAILHDVGEMWTRAAEVSREMGTTVEAGFETFVARARRGLKDESDWTYIRKDGTRFPVRLSVTAMRDAAGTIQGFLAIGSDITEKKRAEAELVRAKEAAEQAMRARTDFLARMSHEIRTPMNGVIGMTDLALQTALTTEQRDYLETARASAGGLLSLIDDILDFSKMDAGKLQLEVIPFRPQQVLAAGLRALSSQAAAKGLELIFDVAPDVPRGLRGDPHRLQQIITNLVGNAVKFTDSGEVTVRVAVTERSSDRIMLGIEVCDSGIGIAPDKQAVIFEAFSQADEATTRRFGGTGLGLAICCQLVELMGGRIAVESTLGRGSKFSFTAGFEIDPHAETGRRIDQVLTGMRALVIDDHRGQRAAIASLLESWGMRVTTAAGLDAIDQARLAEKRGDAFGIIVLDADLPGIDSFELALALRQNYATEAPFILLTTGQGVVDSARTGPLEPRAQVTKPIVASLLLESIQALLTGRPPLDEPEPVADRPVPATRSWRVLVAEDNAVNRKVVTRLLEKMGCQVTAVEDGRQAIAAVAAQRFDVILMDVQMPVMDGLEATRALRAAESPGRSRLPIIALTAQAMRGDRERCLAAGMDGYVTKPIEKEALLATMDEVIDLLRSPARGSATPATAAAGPAFNREELLGRIEGDEALLHELIGLFLAEEAALVLAVESAVIASDARAVSRAAHTLKGSLLSLAAHPAAVLARALEEQGRGNDLGEAAATLTRLREALQALDTELRRPEG